MTPEYNGPTVYRVYDIHPAVRIEFSGEELVVLERLISSLRMLPYVTGSDGTPSPDEERLEDIVHRIRRAHTVMRTKFYDSKGERKAVAE